ncbi:DUF6976 family protein [Acidocella aromatica]|uniref:Uncharacterized protein n=1 Tax=Acidocella aromatica TaxID=1303579 RepID=A0A840V7I4_9PROT|nr:hypothetical protein [Acidocella aromatica]MBB5371938.1 hypothetical protein [Acidocella aromatica]
MIIEHGAGTKDKIAELICEGRVLVLAGDEADLAALPSGRWIGGTAAHFITAEGGQEANGRIFYSDLTRIAQDVRLNHFNLTEMRQIGRLHPANGFTIAIVPGFSELLAGLSAEILDYEGIYSAPLFGWVSAVSAGQLGTRRPKSFAGNPVGSAEQAAVMGIALPDEFFAQLHIANLFSPGTGPGIRFANPGFVTDGECLIGGKPGNLARYIEAKKIDPRLPLVADHEGALINISIISSCPQTGRSTFLAPVNPALTYRFAVEVLDYQHEFSRLLGELGPVSGALSCVCVQNYEHAGLHEAADLPFQGPVTFGQIAYSVLNQTLACLTVSHNAEDDTGPGSG